MKVIDTQDLFKSAIDGDRRSLSRLVTYVEEGGERAELVNTFKNGSSESTHVIGLTGAPGAGKSTLTSALISEMRNKGLKVAVLAVDPSSPFSGGAILGDRVRMGEHALDSEVFIRSLASRGEMGGLALAVPDVTRLLAEIGFNYVIIETVGVGQVEVEIAKEADTTIVVLNPGWGDSVQANKAGLMEIADIFVINKSDRPGSKETERDINSMLDLSQFRGWRPPVRLTIGTEKVGAGDLFSEIQKHKEYLIDSGELETRRRVRLKDEIAKKVEVELKKRIDYEMRLSSSINMLDDVVRGVVTPSQATKNIVLSLIDGLKDHD